MFEKSAFCAAILAASCAGAQPCPHLAGAVMLESGRYAVAYRTRPDPIVVGQHFAMDVVLCPRANAEGAVENLRIDAHMPEHRHGMNYRVTVKAIDDARYVAEGLMFHMAGRWELVFDVRARGRTDRLTRSVTVE